ncbi:MAG: hypothetical protein ABSB56_05655 [Nitrososphaerales archaeon]
MMFDRVYVYAALAVAVAVTYGVWVGPYWVTDEQVFLVVACVVAFICFTRGPKTEVSLHKWGMRVGTGSELEHREPAPRSRIAHYAFFSRTKSTASIAWLRRESDSPFERALFSEPGWRTLSGESLEEISKKVTDAAVKGVMQEARPGSP